MKPLTYLGLVPAQLLTVAVAQATQTSENYPSGKPLPGRQVRATPSCQVRATPS
jgi:hypothetical protein